MKPIILAATFLVLSLLSTTARADSAVAWGNNGHGEVGDGTTNGAGSTPVPVSGMDSGVTDVAAGYFHSLSVKDGGAYAWGDNLYGQLGDATYTRRLSPVLVSGLDSGVTTVAGGGYHSLAVQNGAVYAWGRNWGGVLGNGVAGGRRNTPVAIGGMDSGVTTVAAGYLHNLAVKNGGLYAWGDNSAGQLGNGTLSPSNAIPTPVSGLASGVTAIAGGFQHSLAVKDGGVYSWGWNNYHQLGDGTYTDRGTPELVAGLESGATAVAADLYHSLAVVNGGVYAWGRNNSGQLGCDPFACGGISGTPIQVDPTNLTNIVAVAAETQSSYALSSDGSLWQWGFAAPSPFTPQHLLPPTGYKFTSVAAINEHVVATLRAVPEPSTCLLAATALGLCLAQRRRRGARIDNPNAARRSRGRQQLSIALVLGLIATFSNSAANVHAATLRTVALSGQPVPGAPDGTVFTGFGSFVVLNDAGQTAFRAGASDDFYYGSGIWSEGGGSLNLVAAAGQQAPGLPEGVTYTYLEHPQHQVINDAGSTAFSGHFTIPGSPGYYGYGFWSSGPGGSALIARSGEQAAGTPAGVVYILYDGGGHESLVMNNAGQTAFWAGLSGPGVDSSNDRGVWAQRHGGLELVARTGNHAPGTPDGVNFGDIFLPGGPALNGLGQTAFPASLTGPGVDDTNNAGIWSEASGSLALVARTGSQAPGMPDGAVFTGIGAFDLPLNAAGQTAFHGRVTGAGVDDTNNAGIWSDASGSLALVVRSGTPAPGTPSGVNFRNFANSTSPALNDGGQIAFKAQLTGGGVDSTNDFGFWSGAPGSPALVAREGDHAPGTEDGVVFGAFRTGQFGSLSPLILNAAGQTAFVAWLTGSGISAGNDFGIWATDRSGILQLIARTGDPLEVAPGDFRTVNLLTFLAGYRTDSTGNSDGRATDFNNLGQVAFRATFTDGSSGIFVSNRVAVPEPSGLVLAGVGLLGLIARRKRSKSTRPTNAHADGIV